MTKKIIRKKQKLTEGRTSPRPIIKKSSDKSKKK